MSQRELKSHPPALCIASRRIALKRFRSCGPFIWLDLGQFMEARTIEEERRLSRRLIESGVWLATGEAYTSEIPGWYRITFAVSKKDLSFGFDRCVRFCYPKY